MEKDGNQLPPELRLKVKQDPVLRQLAERAASTGNSRPLQEEATRRMLEIVQQNPGEFSSEDLEALAQFSQAQELSGDTPQSADQLRAAIAQAQSGRAVSAVADPAGTRGVGGTPGAAPSA